MSKVNTINREIIGKIVYYGPGLGGKTTNLQYINDRVAPEHRERMHSLKNAEDRTLFFDLLPINVGEIMGFKLRFQLFTVPGQVYYNASRRHVLSNADGIVFVADSNPARFDANIESMQNLYDNCKVLGISVDQSDARAVPLVLQYNKRDMPGATSLDELERALNPDAVPAWEAVASTGIGVFETLSEVMKVVEDGLRSRFTGAPAR